VILDGSPDLMRQADVKRLMRHGVGLIMALLLGESFSPGKVHAACGDHVRYSGGGNKAASVDPASSPAPVPLPCTGPGCSSQPTHPPLAPVQPTTTDNESWCCLVVPMTAPPADRGSLLASFDLPDLPALPSSIFHPPRS
jgi:hypothetical protein